MNENNMNENNMNENSMNENNMNENCNIETGNVESINLENVNVDSSVKFAEESSKEPEMSGVYSNASFQEMPPRKEKARKEKKKSGGFFKKVLVSVSLGILFGLFAGAGFFVVQRVGDMLMPRETVEANGKVEDVLGDNTVQNPISVNTNSITLIETDVTNVAEKVMPAMVSIIKKYTVTSSFFGQTFSEN